MRGRVTRSDTGEPVPRARISLIPATGGYEPRTALTDDAGKYEFRELPVGQYRVSAS